jgi:GT2 family glycosyltransferase/glycosyltransferase involved in cell wall biosynthesis
MRILVVVHGFPPAAQGGSEIYAHDHARTLARVHGDEVLVLTREQDRARAEYAVRRERRDGLEIAWVNNTFGRTRSFEETYRNEAIGAIAGRIIDEFRPDAAHIHHLTCLSTMIPRSLAERGVPTVMTLHDYWLMCHRGQLLDLNLQICDGPEPSGCDACLGAAASLSPLAAAGRSVVHALERGLPGGAADPVRRAAEQAATLLWRDGGAPRRRLDHMRAVCASIDRFLAPSVCLRDRFVRFGIDPGRITLSRYGVDHAPFRAIARTASPALRLGFLGSLMASKAPHVLLDAAARLPADRVSVELIGGFVPYHGDASYQAQLAPLVGRAGVTVRGLVAHERIADALASVDVLVVPSIWPENSPLVIQEAFLAGVPVVASRIGGIPEVVEEGTSGLLFEAGNSGDLARVLRRLLDEPDLLPSLRGHLPIVRTIEDDVARARSWYVRRDRARPPRPPPRVAAVVLNHGTPSDTLIAVKSLLASRRALDEIVLVDNDVTPTAAGFASTLGSPVSYVHTGANLGFSGGMNAGIRRALDRGAGAVLLANSDIVVPPDCVGALESCLRGTPHAGIAGPIVLARAEPDVVASLGMTYKPATGRMRHQGCGPSDPAAPPAQTRVVDGVSGCLMLVSREVFDAVGLLDEDYFFSFEDLDFCLRARSAGFTSVVDGRARVYHEGGRSIGASSPRRLYFAARNHLLVAARATPRRGLPALLRGASIVCLNLAHAARARGGSLPERVGAVLGGTRAYLAGRFGAGP